MSRNPKFFSRNGKRTSNYRELSTSEVAQILKEQSEKHALKESETCPHCKLRKLPGYRLCKKCEGIREMLISENERNRKEQEKLAERYKPRAKNRRKSVIINSLLRKYTT